ncbi:hypothetical protein G5V59_27530 [Nocardioides sp. W3-2-3]|uniref:hypothetical protein n=1 Tax=Nocardioides convexus TaxID=2712224 RepID=UPI0024188A95|nr:hypothetical protein [Nocardioides convexus]NHA02133.1 hypothetical protein [Nocardioides convexus]
MTQTSSRNVEADVPFHDNVRVSNAPADYAVTATATLYGPYPAQPTGEACQPAEVAARKTFAVRGPGTYPTPDVTVPADKAGYYTWVISLPATADTAAVTTPCGIVQETTLVSKPLIKVTLATQISAQASNAGDQVHDTFTVTGMEGETITEPLTVEWTLYGPVAPVNDSCAGLDWDAAKVLATGKMTVTADGSLRDAGDRAPGRRMLLLRRGAWPRPARSLPTPTRSARSRRPRSPARTSPSSAPRSPTRWCSWAPRCSTTSR